MGINTFTFDGISSDTYDVYISNGASYNAPERAVEMLEIPGRNGYFALDQGRFNNVEVTYTAFIDGEDMEDYSEKLSDLRNWLCSKIGYVRLSDSYNPNEYRMAIYKSGLEIENTTILSGEFNIVFECQPQRFLTSGETKTTLTSGNAITNPTLFPSRPQLQVYGYGDITVGNYSAISVENVPLGNVILSDEKTGSGASGVTLDVSALNTGDTITVSGAISIATIKSGTNYTTQSLTISSQTGCSASVTTGSGQKVLSAVIDDATFVKGTSSSQTATVIYEIKVKHSGTTTTTQVTRSITLAYNGSTNKVTISATNNPSLVMGISVTSTAYFPQIFGDSTKSAFNPLYIDLDIGEAYVIISGTSVSANNVVSIPAVLPTLPSGDTEITYDNTITQLDIVPRWWRV